ncbi:ricin-type beta-trefoil lectin domain protein (plasmid) [Streptomyces sp. AHU1]|uniref:ricin-type beta-trefoil lectin domain protein n=1 Tax=Streptomyces sp. AHU1 TaxID=3377215 RepID=UPI003877E6BF
MFKQESGMAISLKRRPPMKATVAVGTAVVMTVGAVLLAGANAQADGTANPGKGFPAHYAAPYTEMWNSPSVMTEAHASTGLKYFTLAFVINGKGSCNATLNGDTAVSNSGWISAINALRGSGGDVIASFGGAAGTELGVACTSVGALKAQYKKVIDTLNLTRVDFDVEGGALNNSGANDRRNQALAELQQEYAKTGRKLDVQYTLPASVNGLEGNSMSLLRSAKQHGLRVNLVNIMTMDYGPAMDMGDAAISAAQGLHNQLKQVWSDRSNSQLWAMEGNTPMIGVNDAQVERFTAEDAKSLEQFAHSHGIQELSFWSLGRDKACSSNGKLSDSCSGTPQSKLEFARTFNALASGTGSSGGQSSASPSTTPAPSPSGSISASPSQSPSGSSTPTPTATGSTPGTSPSPQPSSSGASDGPFHILGLAGKCVSVQGGKSVNAAKIVMAECNGSDTAQAWSWGSDGTLQALGKCLDPTYARTEQGRRVQIFDCNGNSGHVWKLGTDKSLVNVKSGRCLDVRNHNTNTGALLQIWDCTGGSNQKWSLVPA